ncbi:PREDICTED: DNA-directed RNA polymerases I and III subunit RPAC2-like [Fragaria vesca subsp. vesca]|uniref:DNA-directed RNA polymerases I and III subunit RPAC2-like n=1 Tax=Fragaria vesca subsp. vesca TaxID=101020 RepID=UPI0002C31349|nr:PREDICTED: DNA-directed RNA polymerases I and III subunit RPAC2-like [Fragaria vesca subsp. vesca]
MELGTLSDPSQSTFSLIDEYHTFANAIRFTLNQDPRTRFCGYSIPHPSDNLVNIRIQTTEESKVLDGGGVAAVIYKAHIPTSTAIQQKMYSEMHVRISW